MTEENKKIMMELYLQGVPKTKIAEKLGCTPSTILRNIRALGVKKEDPMIGKVFGKLTVLERAEKRKDLASRCIRYKCQCECGNIIEVDGGALRGNHTTSCGCTRKENCSYKDLTNQRFGKLVVLEMSGTNNQRRKEWLCKCDCGNKVKVDSHSLLSGGVKSCGCLHSWKEIEIEKWLMQNNIFYKKQFTFQDLRGKRNPLRFDFAILDGDQNLQCLIEYNGTQHTDSSNKWHTSQLISSDERKKQYCLEKNIPLYVLTKEDILEDKLKEICELYGYKLSRNN